MMAGEQAPDSIFIGASADGQRQSLVLRRANRHGLIAGATGTGKTVTLQGIAEDFSRLGVPVFLADVKGDLSGIAMAGSPTSPMHANFAQRAKDIGEDDWSYSDNPAIFWDLFGEQGHPIRATVTEMGPLLLSQLLDLNDVQEGVLTVAFTLADKEGLLLLDLDDLQAMLGEIGARGRAGGDLWQCLQGLDRRDPARAAPAPVAGCRSFLRRAGARHP